MNSKITVFLIALAMIFSAVDAQARVVKQEQSWLDKIFSNDDTQMVQKSPFGQPQKRVQNPRQKQLQNQPKTNNEEARTQPLKEPEKTTRLGRHTNAPKNDLTQNYAERVQNLRQQRINGLNKPKTPSSSNTDVNN